MNPSQDDSLNTSLLEDQKNFRKLRKILRQIEHLRILPRTLNKDEESKVAKRMFYRDKLEALNLKYANQTELLTEIHEKEVEDSTDKNSFFLNESSNQGEIIENNIQISSAEVIADVHEIENLENLEVNQVEPQKTVVTNETKKNKKKGKKNKDDAISKNIDELSEMLNKIDLGTKQEISKPLEIKQENLLPAKTTKTVEKKVQEIPKKVLPKVSYDTNLIIDAHEDLIVSIDICTDSNLIVTGSRDTTLKIWNTEGVNLHSFGGHSKSLTFVKFWPYRSYLKVCETLKNNEEDIDLPDFEEVDEGETEIEIKSKRDPLILSSSLDCTLRLWSVYKGCCIKQFYLYNPVNSFDILETSILVGLEAGKIEYWKDLKQKCEVKIFNDSDSIVCIKFLSDNPMKFCALTNNGNAQIGLVESDQSLSFLKELDLHDTLICTYSNQISKNFKSFEILDENKIIAINDNQSFVILYDFSTDVTTFKIISTNSNSYGFTSCFCKLHNQFFISSYDIDNALSVLNVFNYGEDFTYQYTLHDKEDSQTYCISTLAAQNSKKDTVLVSGSSKSFKIWKLCDDTTKKNQIKILKMSQKVHLNTEVMSSDADSDNDEPNVNLEHNPTEYQESDQLNSSTVKKFCSIQ